MQRVPVEKKPTWGKGAAGKDREMSLPMANQGHFPPWLQSQEAGSELANPHPLEKKSGSTMLPKFSPPLNRE